MSVKAIAMIAALAATLALSEARAQGFAGMGADADGFSLPAPDPVFTFPKDHGPHPDFRIEWWYVTANLQDASGADYGVQWTLFRSALRPPQDDAQAEGWNSPQIWFAHAGVTSKDSHLSGETYARGGTGQAGVTTAPFAAWIDDWSMVGQADAGADPGTDALSQLDLRAVAETFSYQLRLSADGPVVFQGDQGFSVKSPAGQASYYYSQPHYNVTGQLDLPDGPVTVTGQAWLDREWSSQPLQDSQTGWDWFSLHFDDGAKLMVYRLRDATAPAFTPGTWVDGAGIATAIPNGQISLRPLDIHRVAGRDVPVAWEITWPERDMTLTTQPLNPDSWMDTAVPYWEGPIRFSGTHQGRGYLEMTGYE